MADTQPLELGNDKQLTELAYRKHAVRIAGAYFGGLTLGGARPAALSMAMISWRHSIEGGEARDAFLADTMNPEAAIFGDPC